MKSSVCRRAFVLCALTMVSMQNAAIANIPAWKLRKWSVFNGEAIVYFTPNISKLISLKTGSIMIFEKGQKYFTTLNPKSKTYHKEAYDSVGKTATLIMNLEDAGGAGIPWVKSKNRKSILGNAVEHYRRNLPNGKLIGEALFFADMPCVSGKFLHKLLDIPDLNLELAELTWYRKRGPEKSVKTLAMEKVSLPPDFFVMPKDYKLDTDRFTTDGSAMDSIRGFAEDLMEEPGRKPTKDTAPKRSQ